MEAEMEVELADEAGWMGVGRGSHDRDSQFGATDIRTEGPTRSPASKAEGKDGGFSTPVQTQAFPPRQSTFCGPELHASCKGGDRGG